MILEEESITVMAYRIPLQNGRRCGNLTGWSKFMHVTPSLPLFLRSPAVTRGPWTVEVVTFSCILITLGAVCLIWTALNPHYGSFLLGGALVTFGACWLGVVCALRFNLEERRSAAIAAAVAAATVHRRRRTSADGGEDTDDEETTMIDPENSHNSSTSTSAVSFGSDFRPNSNNNFRPGWGMPDLRINDNFIQQTNNDATLDFQPSDFRSENIGLDFRSVQGDFQSQGEGDVSLGNVDFLHTTLLRPDVMLPAALQNSHHNSRPDENGRQEDNVRQSPEGSADNPDMDDFS